MTSTRGAVATAVLTVAVWPLPPFRAIRVGVPAMVVMAAVVPVRPALTPVTVYTVPTVVPVVKVMVAAPVGPVVAGLGVPSVPPVPVFVKRTDCPGWATALPYWSAICAVMVTGEPMGGV